MPGVVKSSRPTPISRRSNWTSWLWLLPAFIFISVYLIYPAIDTFRLSFMNANSTRFVGFENYLQIFTNSFYQSVLLNNLLWIFLFAFLVVALGLLFAVLAGRVRYEAVAKAMIFIPMAISFVAASVIWRFVYAYRPPGFDQIGLLNAVTQGLGLDPQAWLVAQSIVFTQVTLPDPLHTNNLAIIIVGVWIWTGFARVI